MFKRALTAHHWMAIGLEKWNEFETMDIPATRVKKMRKIKDADTDSDDESDESPSDLDQREIASADDDLSQSDAEADSDILNAAGSDDNQSDVAAEAGEEEVKPSLGTFSFCPVCPGRRFLTTKDMEDHTASAKHLKRVAAAANAPEAAATVEKKTETSQPKKQKKTEREPKVNRKARRAALARTDSHN